MIFPFATSFVAVLALGQTALAALTPAQVVTNIGIVTTISGNTNSALVPLSVQSTPAQVQDSSTSLVNNFNQIIQSLNADVTAMSSTPPFVRRAPADASDDIVAALHTFVAVHQTLLGTVIGKHSFFAQFSVTGPILAILRSLEAAVDAFANSLIALIPTKTSDVQLSIGQLGDTLSNTIATYQQLCIPSPLYPTIKPVCVAV